MVLDANSQQQTTRKNVLVFLLPPVETTIAPVLSNWLFPLYFKLQHFLHRQPEHSTRVVLLYMREQLEGTWYFYFLKLALQGRIEVEFLGVADSDDN